MQELLENPINRKHQNFGEVIQSYIQLTKPRIIPLLLITTAAAMFLASQIQALSTDEQRRERGRQNHR